MTISSIATELQYDMHCWAVIVIVVLAATRPNNSKGEQHFSSLHRRIEGRTTSIGFISDIVQRERGARAGNLRRPSSRDEIHRRIDHFSWRRRRRRWRGVGTSTNERLCQLRDMRNDDNDGGEATLANGNNNNGVPFENDQETRANESRKYSHIDNWDNNDQRQERRISCPTVHVDTTRRRFVISSTTALVAATTTGILGQSSLSSSSASAAAMKKKNTTTTMQGGTSADDDRDLAEETNFQRSPINKRSGITLAEPERIYPIPFITYLSRFLLVFDDACQRYWYTQARAIPPNSSGREVERIRFRQFGQFAASVEVGLMDFEGKDGVERLMDSLVERYGPSFFSKEGGSDQPSSAAAAAAASSLGVGDATILSSLSTTTKIPTEREVRKSKEALRQIALLFSLLESEYQPVDSITRILAYDDDACIDRVEMVDGGAGYGDTIPAVTFPDPPTLGTKFGGSVARGVAVMKATGRILSIEVVHCGSGYTREPSVTISYPVGDHLPATARAYLGKKKSKGSVDRIELVFFGQGYNPEDWDGIVTISPPEEKDGVTATARAILDYEVSRIDVIENGRGYASEKPINVVIEPPPPNPNNGGVTIRSAFAVSYPKGKATSYGSFIGPESETVVSASISNVDTSQWIAGPTSSQLLALLPAGFGVQYDDTLERYVLGLSSGDNDWKKILDGSLEGQKFNPINPIFGFRGRSPIERERTLDVSTWARFIASGGICSSIAHLVLTPLDVVKTKIQTKPTVYNSGIVASFTKVLDEEGVSAFFNGWEPTFIGFFLTGGVGFFLTEYFRRYYTTLITSVMSLSEAGASTVISSMEIPLIAASAATAGFFCCFILAPFDAVRIRTVSQPDYADNIFGVVSRMIGEEGLLSLFSSVPVWFVKEIPYNIFKFLVFQLATNFLYESFPAAREDIRLSLLVSLVGGTLGGIAATIVSNPADVVISEMKKKKTEMTGWEALERVRDRAGGYLPAFATGLSLRMIFISLLVSLQFFLYDSVRIALGVGSDDMKLYLNVLNAALNKSEMPG